MAEKRAFQLGILKPVKIPLPNSNHKVASLPPSLIPAPQKIAILGLKTGLWQWYNGISVCNFHQQSPSMITHRITNGLWLTTSYSILYDKKREKIIHHNMNQKKDVIWNRCGLVCAASIIIEMIIGKDGLPAKTIWCRKRGDWSHQMLQLKDHTIYGTSYIIFLRQKKEDHLTVKVENDI